MPEPEQPQPGHDGTEPRAAGEPITWREMVADFLKPGRAQVVLAAILLICGLGVVMQVRSQAGTDYTTLRRADLVQMLDDLNAETRRLEGELATLQDTKRQLQTGADRQRVAREEAQRRLDVLSILAGTAPAQGAGIRVTISDPSAKVTSEILLNALQEMRDAGAEVIAINNSIRVVATTWIASSTTGLVVDDQVVTRPIVIEIIGDPHALTEAAKFRGGLVSEVQSERIGGDVTIVSDERITISAVRAPKPNQYARPA